jgi:nitrite reductase (NADH) large subunit
MKRIAVIGGSVAAVAALERLRDNGISIEPVFIFLDEQVPAMRHYFPQYLSQEIKPADVLYRKKDFYERLSDEVYFNKKIERINFKKNRITTSEKEQIDYDVLIIGDLNGPQWPDIKGKNKTGVYWGDRFNDIAQLRETGANTDIVAIESDSVQGLLLAKSLVKQRREVMVFTAGGWSASLNENARQWVEKIFETTGIRLFCKEKIVEILGEAEVKAIRQSNGKLLECQNVLFTDLLPDLRPIAGTDLVIEKGIVVDNLFRTSIENVFAVDTVINRPVEGIINNIYQLESQGDRIAAFLSGEETHKESGYEVLYQYTDDDLSLDIIGNIAELDAQVANIFDPEQGFSRALYIKDDLPVGAVLINDRKNLDKFLRLIKEKANLKGQDQLSNIDRLSE